MPRGAGEGRVGDEGKHGSKQPCCCVEELDVYNASGVGLSVGQTKLNVSWGKILRKRKRGRCERWDASSREIFIFERAQRALTLPRHCAHYS